MANEKISAMTAATLPLTGAELFPLVLSGQNLQIDFADLVENVLNGNVQLSQITFTDPTFGNQIQFSVQSNGWNLGTPAKGSMFFSTDGNFAINVADGSVGLNLDNGESFGVGGSDFTINASAGDININGSSSTTITSPLVVIQTNGNTFDIETDQLIINGQTAVNGTFSPVTSISLVNGIVTAIS